MPFKINVAESSGKTFKFELESEELLGKELHDKIDGKILMPELEGYEFEIAGTSDKAGFTSHKDIPGMGLKKLLLTYGKGMKRRPRREGKKKVSNPKPKGLRLRKTLRGRVISSEITQINLKILKPGSKKLSEIFPDQNAPKPVATEKGAEVKVEAAPVEAKPTEAAVKPKEKKPEAAPKAEEAKVEASAATV